MAGKTIGLGLCQSLMDEPHMDVAIVIVNHLRTVATRLHEILPRFTEMPVELITESLLIEPNHVFIIPEQRDLHVFEGAFRLKPIS
jgi:two-component system chemotaxis response regulator CheB